MLIRPALREYRTWSSNSRQWNSTSLAQRYGHRHLPEMRHHLDAADRELAGVSGCEPACVMANRAMDRSTVSWIGYRNV